MAYELPTSGPPHTPHLPEVAGASTMGEKQNFTTGGRKKIAPFFAGGLFFLTFFPLEAKNILAMLLVSLLVWLLVIGGPV